MALVKCKECKTKVSTTALSCPKCGATGEAIAAKTKEETAREMKIGTIIFACLLYTSPSPRDLSTSRMPSSA